MWLEIVTGLAVLFALSYRFRENGNVQLALVAAFFVYLLIIHP